MPKTICLDENFSTTKILTKEKPIIKNNLEDKFETLLFLSQGESRNGEGGLRTKGFFKKSYDDKPLVSIITVVFNGEKYLEQTIQSVISQTYDNVEYIIIDGGSTDGTINIIKNHEEKIDYWVSEKDKGIGDAWNKGLSLVQGKIIGLLNADDTYDRNNLEVAVNSLRINIPDISYGRTQFMNGNRCDTLNNRIFNKKNIYRGFGFMHTAVFATVEAYKKIGLFDPSIRIAVDTDWLIRAYKENINFVKIDTKTFMQRGGLSEQNQLISYNEYLDVLKKHGFDEKKIKKEKIFYSVKYFINKYILKNKYSYLKQQLGYTLVRSMNIIYNILPFFRLKNKFLKFCKIDIGKKSYIHTKIKLFRWGNLQVGNNSVINSGCLLDNRELIRIGNNVSIAHDTKIYTMGHDIQSKCFETKGNPVIIEDDVVIFSNVLIMPGSYLCKGCVIYPGTIVTGKVDSYTIIGSNKNRIIGHRNQDLSYQIDYGYWCAL